MKGLLIGRFQPFHLGHLEAIKFALTKVDILIIGIGSSNKPLQKNNPFNTEERKEMILSSLENPIKEKIKIFYIPDLENHQEWIKQIESIVPPFEVVFTNDELTKFLYSKRGIKVIAVPFFKREFLSGTHIRDLINLDKKWEEFVPNGTKKVLEKIDAKNRLINL